MGYLEDEVNARLAEGWILHGNTFTDTHNNFYQAVTAVTTEQI